MSNFQCPHCGMTNIEQRKVLMDNFCLGFLARIAFVFITPVITVWLQKK